MTDSLETHDESLAKSEVREEDVLLQDITHLPSMLFVQRISIDGDTAFLRFESTTKS